MPTPVNGRLDPGSAGGRRCPFVKRFPTPRQSRGLGVAGCYSSAAKFSESYALVATRGTNANLMQSPHGQVRHLGYGGLGHFMENGSMAGRLHASSVSISIDSESDSHGSHRGETVTSVLTELLDRFNDYEISATWAFHDPAETLLAERIVAHPLGHEIAILGDAAPAQSQFSRAYLLNGLGRRMQTATAAGFSISTLAVFDDWQPRNTDLLVKLGFSMVRGQRPLRRESQGALPLRSRNSKHFVRTFVAPAAAVIVGGKWLANRLQLRQLRRVVDRAHGARRSLPFVHRRRGAGRGRYCRHIADGRSLAAASRRTARRRAIDNCDAVQCGAESSPQAAGCGAFDSSHRLSHAAGPGITYVTSARGMRQS